MAKQRWRGLKGPGLDPESQIAYLESRGITFERIDKAEAAAYLRDVGGFMRTASYKSLYPKTTGIVNVPQDSASVDRRDNLGGNGGQRKSSRDKVNAGSRGGSAQISRYMGLDFSELVDLTEIDHLLRITFLPIALDVEQAAKLSLLYQANKHHEDPYGLVIDYMDSLSGGRKARLEAELEDRRGDSDVYEGDLIDKYVGDMPVWVFAEALDFGDFLELWGYCAGRWQSDDLREMRYLLKDVKDLRNACAHGSAVLNGITTGTFPHDAPKMLICGLSGAQIGTPDERTRWLKNPRTLQMLATLWASSHIVRSDDRRQAAREGLDSLLQRCRLHADWYTDVEPLTSAYRFFSQSVRAWY